MESCHAVGSHRPYPDVFCSANLAFGGFCRLALSSRYSHRDNHGRKGIVDPPPDVRRGWVPLLAAMFLNINALVIAIMIAAFFLHEATALWDASYATTARTLTPIDQHVHSFLEMIPLMAIVSVVWLHWGQFLALFVAGSELARFDINWKSEPLPVTYILCVMAIVLPFELLPYVEEFVR